MPSDRYHAGNAVSQEDRTGEQEQGGAISQTEAPMWMSLEICETMGALPGLIKGKGKSMDRRFTITRWAPIDGQLKSYRGAHLIQFSSDDMRHSFEAGAQPWGFQLSRSQPKAAAACFPWDA